MSRDELLRAQIVAMQLDKDPLSYEEYSNIALDARLRAMRIGSRGKKIINIRISRMGRREYIILNEMLMLVAGPQQHLM